MPGRPGPFHLALAAVLSLALAGCLSGNTPVLGEDPVRTEWALTASGCTTVAATVPVDKFRVERALPQGFEPVDSSGTFGSERESGRTNLTLLTASCSEAGIGGRSMGVPSLALPLVRIRDPGVVDRQPEAHLYAFTIHGEDPALRETLREMGHAENRSKVFANVTSTPMGSGGQASVVADETDYRIRIGSGRPVDRYSTFNVYHAGDRGLLVLQVTWSDAQPVDGSAELSASEGSRMARFMDESTEPAYGIVRDGASLDGAFHLVGGRAAR